MKKLIWTIGFVAAFAVPTLAQQVMQPPQQKEINLKVSETDVNVIGEALGKLPFDRVAPLINKLQAQIIDQQTPRKAEPAPDAAKKE